MKWSDDQHEHYTADEEFKDVSKRDLYYKMMKLIEEEEEVIKRVRKAEEEVRARSFLSRPSSLEVRFRLEISKRVDSRKNWPAIWNWAFMTPIGTINRKFIENYW